MVAFFSAQNLTQSENYIYSRTYLEPVTVDNPTAKQIQSVEYFDGMRRTIQSIAVKASPNGKDIVVPAQYNSSGQQTKSYLPLPVDTQNGALHNSVTEASINSYYSVANAFSEVSLEKSPLNRMQKTASPGTGWELSGTHTKKLEYQANAAGIVRRFKVTSTWNPTTQINDVSITVALNNSNTTNGYYNANTLMKLVTIDEDSNESHKYINGSGQQVLVRQINKKPNGSIENLDTYYLYDEFGNLSAIIPPKAAVSALAPEVLDKLCYQYKYDKYNRPVEKKIPGKGWVYIVYDKQNRPVLAQDANLRTTTNNFGKQGWVFTKYDMFGRIVYTGFVNSLATRASMQTTLNNMSINANNNEMPTTTSFASNGIDIYYTRNAFPTENMTILEVHYYDEYPTGAQSRPAQVQNQATLPSAHTEFTANGWSSTRSTKALPTVSFTKNIEDDGWNSGVVWYDTLGRPVGTYKKNHLGGFTRTESLLDFTGRINEMYTYHSKNTLSTQVTVKDRFLYSPQHYLSKHYQQINSNPEELLSEYAYNDLGQIINKKVGNNLQDIDYTYNIKGWLTGINPNNTGNLGSKLFAYKIKYNTVEGAESPNNEYSDLKVKPKFNGNISEVDWKTSSDNILRRYGYSYDGNNRLRAGFYQNDTNPYLKEYNEILDYDLNGNISSLKRTASSLDGSPQVIDNLSYLYNGNILTSVSDTSQNYGGYPASSGNLIAYDDNGNMTSHTDKGINKISYNHLNLPSSVIYDATYIVQDFFGGSIEKNVTSRYTYSADGTKLKGEYTYFAPKSLTELTRITEYLDNFQYEGNVLQFYANEEGYYDFVQNRYIYNYKDHLGNVRLSYYKQTDGTTKILEENHYYPFGLRHTGYHSLAGTTYRYKYNGKEVQDTGMYDYGWRQYMPELGRWNGMDQLSESYHATSPYAYVMNSPVMFIDPDGRYTSQMQGIRDSMPNIYSGWEYVDGINFGDWNQFQSGSQFNAFVAYMAANGSGGGGGSSSGGGGGSIFSGGSSSLVFNDGLKEMLLPELMLNGKSGWGNQMWNHYNDFMNGWNTQNAGWNGFNTQINSNFTGNINAGDVAPYLTGPALTALGWDKIPKSVLPKIGMRGFVPPGANPNTSVASIVFRKVIPKSWPRVSFLPKATSLGGQLGRVVPMVGIATTVWDYTYNFAPWLAEQWMDILPQHPDAYPDDRGWMMEAGVCFKERTLVLGKSDFYKIEEIKVGDFVLSYNEKSHKTEISKVEKTSKRLTDEILEIMIGKELIIVTKEHPFYVANNTWVKAGDLKINDVIKTKYGFEKVISSNIIQEKLAVYNIEVSGNHNYFVTASQILVHNKKIKSKKKRYGK